MKTVAFYYDDKQRSRMLCSAVTGGYPHIHISPSAIYHGGFAVPDHDVAIFYGLHGRLNEIRKAYMTAGRRTVLLDLGYWGRTEGGRLTGYHRFAVDGLHGTPNFDRIVPKGRYRKFASRLKDFSVTGKGHIVLQGQSAKAAKVYGFAPEQWETETIETLRLHTDRKIVYVPKHTFDDRQPIDGTQYHDGELEAVLPGAWALVSHHSNASIKALECGVPVFLDDGIAMRFSRPLDKIETPLRPDVQAVENFLEKVACCQWNVYEMRRGIFQSFLEEHL